MRPPPMKRHILAYDVQECPKCHCCAPQVDDLPEGVEAAWVRSADYRAVALDGSTPDIPRRFLAYAHLVRRAVDERRFAWATIRAAWGFDDLGSAFRERAAACRVEARDAIHQLHGLGKTLANDQETDQILCLDLLRRAGRFEEAASAASEMITSASSDVLRNIAIFQARRAEAKDDGCHTVGEAVE